MLGAAASRSQRQRASVHARVLSSSPLHTYERFAPQNLRDPKVTLRPNSYRSNFVPSRQDLLGSGNDELPLRGPSALRPAPIRPASRASTQPRRPRYRKSGNGRAAGAAPRPRTHGRGIEWRDASSASAWASVTDAEEPARPRRARHAACAAGPVCAGVAMAAAGSRREPALRTALVIARGARAEVENRHSVGALRFALPESLGLLRYNRPGRRRPWAPAGALVPSRASEAR